MTKRQSIVLAIIVAALILLPLVGNNYILRLATITFMYATLTMAWNVIGGFAGYPLFGIAAFFGLGAYSGAVLQASGIPIAAAWAFAVIVGTAFALLLGFVLLRLRGHAFAIATLVVAEVLRELTNGWTSLTGGGMGLNLPFFGWSPTALAVFFFYVMFALAAVALIVTYIVAHNRLGFALNCIRQNEDAAKGAADIFELEQCGHAEAALRQYLRGSNDARPEGRNRISTTMRKPSTPVWSWRKLRQTNSSRARKATAPIAGPNTVPMPPSRAIMIGLIENSTS